MAKLNVVIPAADVEVIGEDGVKTKYRKVDRYANEGDIIRITDNDDSSYVVEGAFYTVEYLDGADDPQILDEDGDEYDAGHMEYEVYEKVTETHASASDEITFGGTKYRRVDRSAEEGDVIEITELADEDDAITVGGLYRVESIDWAGDPQITDDDGEDFDALGTSYEVYERVAVLYREEQKPLYKEVKRPAKVGERIKIINAQLTRGCYGNGDEMIVTETSWTKTHAVNADFDEENLHIWYDEYVVLEPIESAQPAQPKRLTVGDYAKVTDPRPLREDRSGNVVEIIRDEHDYQPFRARSITDGGENWYYEDELTHATEAEVEAAKQALKYGDFTDGDYAQIVNATEDNANDTAIENADKFVKVTRDIGGYRGLALRLPDGGFAGYANADALRKVTREEYEAAVDPRSKFARGDKVRLISGGGQLGLFDYETGGIYTVNDPKPDNTFEKVQITGGGQPTAYAKPDQLEKVSAEEFAEIERKQAEESKWAAIGRKVNEFKPGDVVKCVGMAGDKAGVGVVLEEREKQRKYLVKYYSWFGECTEPVDIIEMVVPVEQRFDREQVETAQAA